MFRVVVPASCRVTLHTLLGVQLGAKVEGRLARLRTPLLLGTFLIMTSLLGGLLGSVRLFL